MVEVTVFEVNEIRNWLGFRLDEAAAWRDTKAAEYPDDARNTHSAAALRTAAQYVRTTSPQSHGLVLVARIVEAADQSGIELLRPSFAQAPLPGLESQRVANRFAFDNRPGLPETMEHEEFLDELAHAMLRDLKEREFELESDSPLAKLLRAEGGPQVTDPTVEKLAEIAELLMAAETRMERQRKHWLLQELGRLVVKVRDVAIAERDGQDSLQTGGVTDFRTFPQTRLELGLTLAAYENETGGELPTTRDLAEGSTMTHTSLVVASATNALEELKRAIAP